MKSPSTHNPSASLQLLALAAILSGISACGSSGSTTSTDGSGTPGGLDTDDDGLTDEEEAALGTDPNNPDSDFDLLLDGFEVDLGTNPLVANDVSFLSGRVLLPDQSSAASATVRLTNPMLDEDYGGLEVTADSNGSFSIGHAWPTMVSVNTTIVADASASGSTYTGTMSVPALSVGAVTLPDLVLKLLPLTRGKDFFIGIPPTDEGGLQTQIVVMALMNAGDRQASIHWRVPGLSESVNGAEGSRTLGPGESTSVSLPGEELRHGNDHSCDIGLVSRGVRVTSNEPISVAIQSYADGNGAGMTTYACLPTTSYGSDYYLHSLPSAGYEYSDGGYSLVTAGDDDVLLDLLLNIPMERCVNGSSVLLDAGVPNSVQVDFEDSLQFTTPGETFTGSKLAGDAPFGVIGGTTFLEGDVLGGLTQGELVIESLAPTNHWGTSFVTFGGIGDQDSMLSIMAGATGAELTVGNAPPTTLQPGQNIEVYLDQNDPTTITSDRPLLVWQLFGWYNTGAAGVHLAPVERWSDHEVLWAFSATNMESSLAILTPADSIQDVRINGQRVIDMPGTVETSVNGSTRLLITPIIGGSHHVTSSDLVFPVVIGRAPLTGADWYACAYSTVF